MKRTGKVKVGFCIAYDWHLLAYSLPLVYGAADQICLSLDKDRISWAGNSFPFDEAGFKALITSVDIANKITVLEADFHLPDLSPMENEVRQRNGMADHLGIGGWHVQLDCDEYFIDFDRFANYLRGIEGKRFAYTNVCCSWITLYKQTVEGFLFVAPDAVSDIEYIQVATLNPRYEYGRRNGDFNVYTNYKILHQSWARPSDEVLQKLENWGHKNDFDGQSYFARWSSVTASNYTEVRDFHPTEGKKWPVLKLLKGASAPEVIRTFRDSDFVSRSSFSLFMVNSRWVSRLRRLFTLLS